MCLDYRKTIFAVLTVVWMAVIFWFSSAPADESTDMSLSAGMFVGKIVIPDFEKWTAEEQKVFAETIDHPVRKTAHAGEYALLGILTMGSLGAFYTGGIRRKLSAWMIASVYAATDEIHQLFVAGRSCQFSDVILDSAGAAAGILLCTAILILCRKD